MNKRFTGMIGKWRMAVLLALVSVSMSPTIALAAPGYNGRILFNDNTSLYSVKSDGTDPQTIVTGGSYAYPFLSPNGQKIAYRGTSQKIYVANVDGSNVTEIVGNTLTKARLVWSPDSAKVAFSQTPTGTYYQSYVVNIDGTNLTQLTTELFTQMVVAWSPDGAKMLFQSEIGGNADIYSMSPTGANKTRLTTDAGVDVDPIFSLNSATIYFSSSRGGLNRVFKMNADGTSQTPITSLGTLAIAPGSGAVALSPDGTQLAVGKTDADYSASVVLINTNGTNLREYPLNPSLNLTAGFMWWSPDQRQIVFYTIDMSVPDTAYFSIKVDGTDLTRVFSATSTLWGWQATPNMAPAVTTGSLVVSANSTGSIDVLESATDEEALDPGNISIIHQPTHGDALVDSSTGEISYTPDQNYSGSDELTFQVCDSFILDQKCASKVLGVSVTTGAVTAPVVTLEHISQSKVINGQTAYTTTSNRPTFSGTASIGATITVTIHSDPIVLSTVANAQGNWSVTPQEDIPNGSHTVNISASLNGQTTTLSQYVLGINTEIPVTGAYQNGLRTLGYLLILSGLGYASFNKKHLKPHRLVTYRL